MIDLVNMIVGMICAFIAGAAVHSAWLHAKKRDELKDWNKVNREDEDRVDG